MDDMSYNPQAKHRVLCLHGMGTNGNVFETQTAALRYRLGSDYDFEFVDGPHPWPPAAGVEAMFGRQEFYSYHDGTASSIVTAVNDLADYLEDNGPFHAIMGFSLGAGLAATLLLRRTEHKLSDRPGYHGSTDAIEHVRGAIFICAAMPVDWQSLEQGLIRQPCVNERAGEITIPTVHAWSPHDSEYCSQSARLVQMCERSKRTEVLHGAGHGVPSSGRDLDNLVSAIQNVMSQLEM